MKTLRKKFVGQRLKRLAMVLFLTLALIRQGRAESYGVNFLGNTAVKVTGSAGVIPMANWNNLTNATFTAGNILSSDGLISATLTLGGASSRTWNSGTVTDGGNNSLLNGYMDLGANNTVGSAVTATNVISGLPGSQYDVILYMQADAARPGSNSDRLPNYTINGTTYYTATLGGSSFGGFVRAGTTLVNNNLYPPGLTYGNYVEVDNVAPLNGTITILGEADTQSWRSPLNGIEIVASTQTPRITDQPAAGRLYVGNSVQLSVGATSPSPIFYRWRKGGIELSDGGNVSGAATSSLTISNLVVSDTGDYTVFITNFFGSVTSSAAHLEVVTPTVADLAFDAFNAAYLIQTNGLTYYCSSLTNRSADGTWTEAIDIQVAEDAYERTQSPQQKQLVNDLCASFISMNPPPWSWDGWNDDIGWDSLVLIRGYQMTGNTAFLNAAALGFNFAFNRGWDTNYNGGGIWEQQPANMPAGQAPAKNPLACDSLLQTVCMLYQSTSNAVYLGQAQLIYGWVRTNLFNTNTGVVYGSIETNGTVNTTPNLYNQGTFVDCANLLHNITGQQVYYNDALLAVECARNTLTSGGIFNNSAAWLNTWAAEFARGMGHFVKDNNLWNIYYPWMQANANAAWDCRRTDLNISWNQWTQPTPAVTATYANGFIANWAASAVVMAQVTPPTEPGFVACTNQLAGAIIGTTGSWNNGGNIIAKVFDNNLSSFFDGPDNSGDWVGLDFGTGVSNVIGQINYYPRPGSPGRMLGGFFQGANNPGFLNPVTLCTVATTPLDNGVFTFQPVTNRTAFRYVRYYGPANGSCNVAEIKFFSVNPPPPPASITNSWNGSQLSLSWQTGGTLLESANVSGPWTTNSSAMSPFIVVPIGPSKFYRIIQQ